LAALDRDVLRLLARRGTFAAGEPPQTLGDGKAISCLDLGVHQGLLADDRRAVALLEVVLDVESEAIPPISPGF